MKQCTRCREEQPLENFYANGTDKAGNVRRASHCKTCKSEYYRSRWQSEQALRDRVTNWNLTSKYGISLEQRNAMIEAQGNKCPICLRTPEQWCVDHCHASEQVRGILCHDCNLALGKVRDEVETLKRAIAYLEAS